MRARRRLEREEVLEEASRSEECAMVRPGYRLLDLGGCNEELDAESWDAEAGGRTGRGPAGGRARSGEAMLDRAVRALIS